MEHEDLTKEFREFAALAASALQTHRETLQRHEENLKKEFETAKNHREAIEELRQHLHALAESINSQNLLLADVQKTMLKVISNLGMAQPGSDEISN